MNRPPGVKAGTFLTAEAWWMEARGEGVYESTHSCEEGTLV